MQNFSSNNFTNLNSNPFSTFLNRPNYFGQLSLPPLTPIGFNNPLGAPDDNLNDPLQIPDTTNINDSKLGLNIGDYPIECLVIGANCPDSMLGGAITNISNIFKKLGLLMLALILLAFGLYMLAKSTDTGKAVINLAGKV